MTLQNRRDRQELRYDGLVLVLTLGTAPEDDDILLPPPANLDDPGGAWEMRVVGKVSCWDVRHPEHPEQMGEPGSFSMVRLDVDRRKLFPTIKPFMRELSMEELQIEMEQQRAADKADEDELRRIIDNVRRRKRQGDWPPSPEERPTAHLE
eukprot:CAMPEP_0119385078 /NCGR_PEP_ID=MMETSP1334-20130426/89232_1 /TAXON_ID=127549 /ORGANISM="Calcidiscus leptoporus, Strain RCC1130" /LENGTH=150 /DNA_ID=CAMNT_0007406285 /DNA_START=64 /DNA_END=516 /DNA_ORIENTATION=-